MKLINYNYGCAIEKSSTWYRGKLEMSRKEWRDVQIYLFNPAVLASHARPTSLSAPFRAQLMREDIARAMKLKDGSLRLTVRTTATDAIVARFKPTNAKHIKRQNYFIHVRP